MHSFLLAATQAADATPTELGPVPKFLIITITSLLILFIAGRTIERPHDGPKALLPFPALFNNPSWGTLLGSVSLGHIVGTLLILGFAPYLQ